MLTAAPQSGRRWSLVLVSLATALVLVASGCSDDGNRQPSTTSSSVSTSTAPPLATTATITRLTGNLKPKRRKAVVRQVKAVVDGWWDAAYLSPGKDGDPFPGFTRGAADLARRDRDVMTAAALRDGAGDPVAVHRSVGLDILAVNGRPAGVTAHVWLAVKPSADAKRAVVAVRGLLDLSRQDGKWRIFGYSMTAGPPPAPQRQKKQHATKQRNAKKQDHRKKDQHRKTDRQQRKHHEKKHARHRKGKS